MIALKLSEKCKKSDNGIEIDGRINVGRGKYMYIVVYTQGQRKLSGDRFRRAAKL